MDQDPKRLPNIISKITYLGIGIKPKNKVSLEGDDPTYLTLKTKDEMISLRVASANTIIHVLDIDKTYMFSPGRNLWMLVEVNC